MKNNRLIISILVAMVLGIIIGVIINNQQTSHFNELKEKVATAAGSASEAHKMVTEISKSEKLQKKDIASYFSVLSDIFLLLIKMIIAPLVLSVLVLGVAKVGDFKSVGRIGGKTLIYFTAATLVALTIGLLLVNIFEPGIHMHLELPEIGADTGVAIEKQTARNFISHVIPDSIVNAMSKNEVLPIVVFSLIFGVAVASVGSKGEIIIRLMDSLSHVMFKVTTFVMNWAPIGVFGAVTAVIIQQGPDVLKGYVYLIVCFFGGLLFFIFVVLLLVCFSMRINFFRLLGHIKEPLLLAFSTASSESAMPQTIEALERFGISNRVVSFVLPLGYSFNLDGSIMYMTFATMFIAQSYGIEISTADQIKMMLILLVTSKGMAGIPRASLVVIAGTLGMFKIPVEGLLLLLAIDQLLDMGRSATNVVGNAVASAVVARWEGELKPVK